MCLAGTGDAKLFRKLTEYRGRWELGCIGTNCQCHEKLCGLVGTIDPVGPEPAFEDTFYADGPTFTRITGRENFNLIQMRDVVFDPGYPDRERMVEFATRFVRNAF